MISDRRYDERFILRMTNSHVGAGRCIRCEIRHHSRFLHAVGFCRTSSKFAVLLASLTSNKTAKNDDITSGWNIIHEIAFSEKQCL